MNKNVKKNYIFNLLYQLFQIIIPIIVTPYISRVLLSDGVGKYSFSYSIVNYFTILASFGFSYYAQREIAKHIDNKEEQSKVFWEIVILKFITTCISIIALIGLIFSNVLESYNQILLIMIINVVAIGFDFSFLLQGNEEFKKTVSSNMIVRFLAIISIFIFVKRPEHVWLYALINSLSLIISNMVIWIYVPKYLAKVKIKNLQVKRHFLPSLKLFIPTIAISVYVLLDRTLIGLMMPKDIADSSVGFYDSAEKIVKLTLTIVTSLSAVMIPNNAKYFARKDYNKVNNNIQTAVKFSTFIGFPLMFGLAAVASNIVPWFFGPGYEPCIELMVILSGLIIAIGLNNVYGVQYLIPTNKENIFTISVVLGAVINLTLNILTIPHFGPIGAALATVIAESAILIFQMIYLRKTFSIFKTIKQISKFFISSLIMFIVVKFVSTYLTSSIINSIILILIGAVVYFVLLLILREKFVIEIFDKINNNTKVKLMKSKVKRIILKLPYVNNALAVRYYTKKGVFSGGLIKNLIKNTFKMTKIDYVSFSNINRINYQKTNYKNFYYYLDNKVYAKISENEWLVGNLSVDYSLIINNSLDDLKKKYPDNKFVDLLILENSKILNIVDNDIKFMFENMKTKKAESLKDALQRILFANQLLWQTGHTLNGLGRLDKILNDYYINDLKRKTITEDYAVELFKEFFKILHNDYRFKSSSVLGDTGQIVILGGVDSSGKYFDSKLTRLILNSLTELNIPDPKILLRVSAKMPNDLLELAIKCIAKGTGSPLLSNDDVIIDKMIDFGYEKEDSFNYCAAACWEVYPFGNSAEAAHFATINYVSPFNNACIDFSEELPIDELINRFKNNLINDLKALIEKRENTQYVNDPAMAFFLNDDKNKNDVDAKYMNFGILTVGVSNVVNAIINIEEYVYNKKEYKFKEMISMLKDNQFLEKLKNNNEKFGEDTERVISLSNMLMGICADYAREYNKTHQIKLKLGFSSPMYIDCGKKTDASLDGRKDGEPFNVHISCSKPLAYTELINFASKLDYSEPVLNGNVIDFSTTPDLINNNLSKFTKLILSGIKKGIYQIQINVVSSEQLIEAKANPEKFPNLIVRVWGFSAYFNDLSDEYKDLLIERTKMYESANK